MIKAEFIEQVNGCKTQIDGNSKALFMEFLAICTGFIDNGIASVEVLKHIAEEADKMHKNKGYINIEIGVRD